VDQKSAARRLARISTKAGTPARKIVRTIDERLAVKKPVATRTKRAAPALQVLTEFYLPRRRARRPVRRLPVRKPAAKPVKKRPGAGVPIARKPVIRTVPKQVSEARPAQRRLRSGQRVAFLAD